MGSLLAKPYKAISLGDRNINSPAILHAVDEKLPLSQLVLSSLGTGGFGTVVYEAAYTWKTGIMNTSNRPKRIFNTIYFNNLDNIVFRHFSANNYLPNNFETSFQ
jgi:hypothetical protein